MKLSVFYEHILEAQQQTGLPLRDILQKLHTSGIEAVECPFDQVKEDPAGFRRLLAEAGLIPSSLHGNCDFACHADEVTGFDLVDAAVLLDVKTVLVVPGFLPDYTAETKERVRTDIASSLNRLCSYAQEKGITVTLEDFDGAAAIYSTDQELAWFLKEVPALRITFDTGNFAFRGVDELQAFEVLKDFIVHVHCKDRSLSPTKGHPLTTADGTLLYPAPVGHGCIHMKELIINLKQNGYSGYLSIEHFGAEQQLQYMLASAEWLVDNL